MVGTTVTGSVPRYVLTRHAVQRFVERVRPAASWYEARAELAGLAVSARASQPRRWLRRARPAPPGTIYLYPRGMPGVALIARAGVIVTVMSKACCRSWQPPVAQDEIPGRLMRLPRRKTTRQAVRHRLAVIARSVTLSRSAAR